MPTSSDQRLARAELEIKLLMKRLDAMRDQITKLDQNAKLPTSAFPGGGAGGGPFYCMPTAEVGPGGGTLAGQAIQQIQNGNLVTVETSGKIVNPGGAATNTTGLLVLGINGDGSYGVIAQFCT